MSFLEIRKNNASVYRDFYSKYWLVFGGDFSFLWIPTGYWHRSKFLHLISKTPLECLVWLRKIKDSKTFLSSVVSYNISTSTFDTDPFIELNKEQGKLEDEISKFLIDNGCLDSFEIGILSETTRWHSFWFSGTFSAILATTLFYVTGKITHELLSDYDTFAKSSQFSEIFNLAWKFELISRYGNTLGPTIAGAMVNSGPIYLMSHEFSPDISLDSLGNTPVIFKKISEKYWNELTSQDIPLDYWMIFTWLSTNTKLIEAYQKGHNIKLNVLSDFLTNEVLDDVLDKHKIYFSRFTEKDSIYNHFCDNLSILNIEVIYLLKQLLVSWSDEDIWNRFIQAFNKYRSVASLIEPQSSFAPLFERAFYKFAKNPDETIGIMPVYSGKMGWWYMFVMKSKISQNTLKLALEEIREQYPDAAIEYASFIEGESTQGIRLLQNTENQLYAPSLQTEGMFIYSNTQWEIKTGDFGELMNFGREGLLLDCIHDKLYWDGQWVTSKDIKSQSTTVQLLSLLVENMDKWITSSQLPNSSYAKSKTEMWWKITCPLIKFIQEKSGKELEIICSGWTTNFHIKLGNLPVPIGFIKKMR